MLRRTGTVLVYTNGPCVYFTVVMKIFQSLLGPPKLLKMPIIVTEEMGCCTWLNLQLWNEIIQYSQKIHCIVLKSGLNFINMGTFQSEIIILATRYTSSGTHQFTVGAKCCHPESVYNPIIKYISHYS